MRLFLDTNVLLDLFLQREPFFEDAKRLWQLFEIHQETGLIAAITFNNVHYIATKHVGKAIATRDVTFMLCALQMVPLDQHIIQAAVLSHFPDFEDAIQYYSALMADADCIITRDNWQIPSPLRPILSPAEFLAEYRHRKRRRNSSSPQ